VVFQQISFARAVDLGLDKDRVVIIDVTSVAPNEDQSLMRALADNPALKGAALSGDVPFSGSSNNTVIDVPGEQGTSVIRAVGVGPGFFSLYGIKLLSGRALSWGDTLKPNLPVNTVINNAEAKRLGYSPDNAIGKTFYFHAERITATIVGVTPDFLFEGDRRTVVPTVYGFGLINAISVKVPAGGMVRALAAIDRTWHAFKPSIAINRHFLDADFEKQFLADEQQGKIFGIFVGIAIFIAALGLFGLAAFSTERRTKEIGLRKTFGARTRDIILLLLWQFSIPVLIANLIAWPVTYYYLHQWLEGYAYRIPLSPLYFFGAGAAALVIAWATVIVHAAHVARANPVHALRYE
jgi:putative ABC transport system permease protein